MSDYILVTLIGLFVAVLVLRLIKAHLFAKRWKSQDGGMPAGADDRLVELLKGVDSPQRAREAIREIGRSALGVKSPTVRGAYHSAAGNLALHPLKRPQLAVGLYLKALRADPTCTEALTKLQQLLSAQKRYRRLEMTYWDILARLDDGEIGETVWITCWSGLAAVYATSPRTVRRADAIRKALGAFAAEGEDELANEGVSTLPKVAP